MNATNQAWAAWTAKIWAGKLRGLAARSRGARRLPASRCTYRRPRYTAVAESLEPRILLTGTITQVGYFDTWDGDVIPSTDVAGITYHPSSGHLYLADSEINEISEFEGDNVFATSLDGEELFREIRTNNDEPTGITYNQFDGYFYVTNDDDKDISRYDESFSRVLKRERTRDAVSSASDPEGITSDPQTGFLYVADGNGGGRQVLVYDADLDFQYRFSVSSRVADPEGIAFDPITRHLFIVSSADDAIFEYTTGGTFIEEYDISDFSPRPDATQGVTFAPTSDPNDNPGALAIYIADGMRDNHADGRVYEAIIGDGGTVDQMPLARDDSVVTPQGTPVTVDVLDNDSLGDLPTRITAVTQGSHGGVTFNASAGTTTYTPDLGFTGADSYTYTIRDDDGDTSAATVDVLVTEPNKSPLARNDTDSTPEDTPVSTNVIGNDDLGNLPAVIAAVTQGTHGSVTFNASAGTATYSPEADYHGSDSYTYTIRDVDGETSTARVDVTVTSVDDQPLARNDSATTLLDTPVLVEVFGNDELGDEPTVISAVTQGTHGGVTFNASAGTTTYTPMPGFTGADSYTYTIRDDDGQTSTATVEVSVHAITSYNSNNVPLNIPDKSTITSTLFVGDAVTVLDIDVHVDFTHTRDGDLEVFLRSPSGTVVELFTDVGRRGDNFTGTVLDDDASQPITAGSAPFAGTFRPEGNLRNFEGENAAGTWTLEIRDDQKRQTGRLLGWSIVVTHADDLVAAGPPPAAASVPSTLPKDQLQPIVAEAVQRWTTSSLVDAAAVDRLDTVSVEIVDLPDLVLGRTDGSRVLIDSNAAGFGWFVDATPSDDVEFAGLGSDGASLALRGSVAYGKMDLLSVVVHEFGHVLGLDHDVLVATLETGTRRGVPVDADGSMELRPASVEFVQTQLMTAGDDTTWPQELEVGKPDASSPVALSGNEDTGSQLWSEFFAPALPRDGGRDYAVGDRPQPPDFDHLFTDFESRIADAVLGLMID